MRPLAAALLSLLLAAPALAATPDEDVDYYLGIFKGDPRLHAMACEDLGWKGISDPRLFDFLEQRILSEEKAARDARAEKDRIARYIRALGFSGQRKYERTIKRFHFDQVYARYSDQALKDLGYYERWNPVISARARWDPALADDANRVMNMLRSDDLLLQRIGAKRVYFGMTAEPVVEVLAGRLKEYYPRVWEGDEADAVAWIAKALGHSAKAQYRALLEEVVAGSPTRSVRNQAASALRQDR